MPDTLLMLLAFIAAVIVYTIFKIRAGIKKSKEQWQQVDRSKLKEWDDEDDWGN